MKCPHCGNQLDVTLSKAPPAHGDASESEASDVSVQDLLANIRDEDLSVIDAVFVARMRLRVKMDDHPYSTTGERARLERLAGGKQ